MTAIAAAPATEAKKDRQQARGNNHAQHGHHGQGHHNSAHQAQPGRQDHQNQGHHNQQNPGRQDNQGGDDNGPTATPSTGNPPSTPSTSPSTPTTSSPSQPTQSQPTPAAPVRRPAARRRRTSNPVRRRASSQGRAVRRTARGTGSTRPASASTSGQPRTAPTSDAAERSNGSSGGARTPKDSADQSGSRVTRTVRDIVKVVPDSIKAILAALAALSVLLGAGSLFSALRARRLDHQRRELLQEVGLLQSALLPPVPATVGALRTSVAYRPAEGAAAGGDFYDALSLPDGRAFFILGDVSGHGRGALERTAFLRYTLRAYLEAGLAPRVALQIAGRVVDPQLGGDFATVLLAVHDPASGSLTYASAGHPAPIVVGRSDFEPVLAASSPPLGVGLRTGLRQTTVPLAPGSVACLYTDGLTEARTNNGILGRGRLTDLVAELGRDVEAPQLLDRVAEEARLTPDDMAVCLFTPTAGVTTGGFRTEVLELSAAELDGQLGRRFLEACGAGEVEAQQALDDAGFLATRFDQVVLHVTFGNRLTVEALPANVESIEAAARRALAS